ncbi:MAG: hypothetical protein JXA42_19820 [Anaerolineales bacterium]|nr:hypothetical protein [Anaerolineales bacterium]
MRKKTMSNGHYKGGDKLIQSEKLFLLDSNSLQNYNPVLVFTALKKQLTGRMKRGIQTLLFETATSPNAVFNRFSASLARGEL